MQIQFNYNPNPWPAVTIAGPYPVTRMLVETLIHEAIHLTGLGDYEMAKRLFDPKLTKTPPPNPKNYPSTKAGALQLRNDSSRYWGAALSQACLPTDEEFQKWWQNYGESNEN